MKENHNTQSQAYEASKTYIRYICMYILLWVHVGYICICVSYKIGRGWILPIDRVRYHPLDWLDWISINRFHQGELWFKVQSGLTWGDSKDWQKFSGPLRLGIRRLNFRKVYIESPYKSNKFIRTWRFGLRLSFCTNVRSFEVSNNWLYCQPHSAPS